MTTRPSEIRWALDEIVLDGAQRMLGAALEAEVDAYVAVLADEGGRGFVVRDCHAEPTHDYDRYDRRRSDR